MAIKKTTTNENVSGKAVKKATSVKKIKDNEIVLTRGTKKLIAQAIEQTGQLNNGVLCDYICENLCSKFSGDSLDYQLQRMNIPTTGAIMEAIDTFVYRHSKGNKVCIGNKGRQEGSEN